MDEDLNIINNNTRNEKIKNFIIDNKRKIILISIIINTIFLSFLGLDEYKSNQIIKISNLYNSTIIKYNENTREETTKKLIKIINYKNKTYSPLSLYFIIDNNLILDREITNDLFDVIIEDISLEKEIKNLIVYKKALYNADFASENELLEILKPVVNSNSVWKSHALYLLAEYFYSKNEKQKSKEFFSQILNLEESSLDIKQAAQKRLNRDLSD